MKYCARFITMPSRFSPSKETGPYRRAVGTFAGFLTCVWDAMEGNIEPAAFLLSGGGATLWETREPAPDQGRARRLYSALARRVSPEFQKMIAGLLLCSGGVHAKVLRRQELPAPQVGEEQLVMGAVIVNLALTKMWTEWDHLKGFVRFSDLDGFLVGEIEPKNRVLMARKACSSVPAGSMRKSSAGRSFQRPRWERNSSRPGTGRWGRCGYCCHGGPCRRDRSPQPR